MHLDLGSAASIVDPAGTFAPWFERGDVHPSTDPRGVAVIGHAAVADAFRDTETLSADRVTVLERVAADRPDDFAEVVSLLSSWMIFRDPPVHTRLREPVRAAFTPRRTADLAATVEAVLSRAFDDLFAAAASGDGTASLTEHVHAPVPALVIGALLGVPDQERAQLQAWSDALASIVFSLRPSATPSAPVVAAARAFRALFGRLIDEPVDPDGLLAHLVASDTDLDRDQLIGTATMLLFAGHETTTNLLQQTAATLLERPDLTDALRAPGAAPDLAVEELLRTLGPARTMVRKARIDHDRAGVPIEAGTTVLLSITAANHDPRVFDDPGRFDPNRSPNPHLGFGWGLHHCLGAALARLEGVAYLRALLDRIPQLTAGAPVPPLGGGTMGFTRGPIRIRAGSARSGTV